MSSSHSSHSRQSDNFEDLKFYRHRPLAQYTCIAATTSVFLLISFVLYLLVALSIPIIKPIYLFVLDFDTQPGQPATSIATDIRFGVWGYCASSVLDLPTIFSNDGECTPLRLGYNVPEDILALTGYPQVANIALEGLTFLLVLHPICAGLSGIGMFTSLFLSSQCMTVFSLVSTIFTAIIGTVALAADLSLEIVARDEASPLTGGAVSVGWGNGVWMVLVAVFCSWVSVILLSAVACSCCGVRPRSHFHHHHHHHNRSGSTDHNGTLDRSGTMDRSGSVDPSES